MASGFLLGSSYGISAGLLVYGFESDIIPENLHLQLLLVWAVVGIVLSLLALRRPKPAPTEEIISRVGQAAGADNSGSTH